MYFVVNVNSITKTYNTESVERILWTDTDLLNFMNKFIHHKKYC